MIKVTVPNGTAYEFADADRWEVLGLGIKVYQAAECVAEFSAFLLVQKITVEEPQP